MHGEWNILTDTDTAYSVSQKKETQISSSSSRSIYFRIKQ